METDKYYQLEFTRVMTNTELVRPVTQTGLTDLAQID
jgi:hypothetical protein